MSLDFFKSEIPARQIVPCGNLFEVGGWAAVAWAVARPLPSPRGCTTHHPAALRNNPLASNLPHPLVFRLWRTRCTWRCRPSARWGQTIRSGRCPRLVSAGGQVGVAGWLRGCTSIVGGVRRASCRTKCMQCSAGALAPHPTRPLACEARTHQLNHSSPTACSHAECPEEFQRPACPSTDQHPPSTTARCLQ